MVTLRIGEKEIPCDFADVTFDGTFLAQYHDDRRLPEIAMDFDGLPEVTVIEPVLEKHYAGFSWLAGVSITADGTVQVRLRKEAKADE